MSRWRTSCERGYCSNSCIGWESDLNDKFYPIFYNPLPVRIKIKLGKLNKLVTPKGKEKWKEEDNT